LPDALGDLEVHHTATPLPIQRLATERAVGPLHHPLAPAQRPGVCILDNGASGLIEPNR
jgi:hypothetical protein